MSNTGRKPKTREVIALNLSNKLASSITYVNIMAAAHEIVRRNMTDKLSCALYSMHSIKDQTTSDITLGEFLDNQIYVCKNTRSGAGAFLERVIEDNQIDSSKIKCSVRDIVMAEIQSIRDELIKREICNRAFEGIDDGTIAMICETPSLYEECVFDSKIMSNNHDSYDLETDYKIALLHALKKIRDELKSNADLINTYDLMRSNLPDIIKVTLK